MNILIVTIYQTDFQVFFYSGILVFEIVGSGDVFFPTTINLLSGLGQLCNQSRTMIQRYHW